MIKVGVTGHRDLKKCCVNYYAKQVNQLLKRLKQEFKDILVLSSLADGADRVVVIEAIKLDIPYIVILPMAMSLYIKDFNDKSKDEFLRLVFLAKEVINLPMHKDIKNIEQILKYNQYRDLQYEMSGEYISDYSDILIALWDGKYIGLKGGTGEIVKYHLNKKNFKIYILYVSRNKDVTNTMVKFKLYENSS